MASKNEYDYIIVGAGSAGCMLAYRLGADPNNRILVLEAGGPDTDPLIHIPLGLGKMHGKRAHDWGYDAEPEQRLNGREIELRGKVVGGSSSINVMASASAAIGGTTTAGPTTVRPAGLMPMCCRTSVGWNLGKAVKSTWRGGGGPLNTQFAKSQDPLWEAWIEAGRSAESAIRKITTAKNRRGSGAVSRISARDDGTARRLRFYGRPCGGAMSSCASARRRPGL